MPAVDIIIPTYNNLDELKTCINGLAQQTETSFRAIFCIDGSTDGTAEYLAAYPCPFEVTVAEHPDRRNHGRNATRNLALPYCAAAYLLLLDSDAIPAPTLVEAHLNLLKKSGDCVSVWSFNYTNTRGNIWARYLMTRGRNRLPAGAEIGFQQFNSGNAAFKASYFTELGGQDAAMTHYGGGDIEFAIRLHDRYGLRFFNTTDAAASSVMKRGLGEGLATMAEFGRYNLRYLYEKHPAHRNLYAMSAMKKYPFLFALAGCGPFIHIANKLIPVCGAALQTALVRYLAVTAVYKGFSSQG
jgi:glycosyltransferase involved in cell wall biosynthesis